MKFRTSGTHLSRLLALARAVHQSDIGYSPGWADHPDENPPIGTLLSVTDNNLVACMMEPAAGMIVHACVPCEKITPGCEGLVGVTAPKDLHTLLARYKDEPVTVECDGDRVTFHLPSPQGLKRNISLPMRSLPGAMLSSYPSETSCSVVVSGKELNTALANFPRDGERVSAEGCTFNAVAGHDGLAVWSNNEHVRTHAYLRCSRSERAERNMQFTCPARQCRDIRRILTAMHIKGQSVLVQVSPGRIMISCDWATAQFFSGQHNDEIAIRPIRLAAPGPDDLVLDLDPNIATIRKDAGKWFRRLVRKEHERGARLSTTWLLTRRDVTIAVQIGLHTEVTVAATCRQWPLQGKELLWTLHPLATADMLDLILHARTPLQLISRDRSIVVQSPKQGTEMIHYATPRSVVLGYCAP